MKTGDEFVIAGFWQKWERNLAGVFPLDQPKRRWEDVVGYNKGLVS